MRPRKETSYGSWLTRSTSSYFNPSRMRRDKTQTRAHGMSAGSSAVNRGGRESRLHQLFPVVLTSALSAEAHAIAASPVEHFLPSTKSSRGKVHAHAYCSRSSKHRLEASIDPSPGDGSSHCDASVAVGCADGGASLQTSGASGAGAISRAKGHCLRAKSEVYIEIRLLSWRHWTLSIACRGMAAIGGRACALSNGIALEQEVSARRLYLGQGKMTSAGWVVKSSKQGCQHIRFARCVWKWVCCQL